MNRTAILATVAALAFSPAFAQQTTPGQKEGEPAQQEAPQVQETPQAQQDQQMQAEKAETFIHSQSSEQWMASQVIGVAVNGSGEDENIGSVNDLLLDQDGQIVGAVIGVGGFLGIGRKDVAVSFDQIELTRDADGNEVAMVQLTKEQLENAPDFERYQQPAPARVQLPAAPGTDRQPAAPGTDRQ